MTGGYPMERRDTEVLFREVQGFRSLLKALLVYPGSLALIVVFGFAMYRQLGRGIPFGREPMPDFLLWFLGPFMVLLGLFLIFLFTTMRLITTVRRDGLYIRYVPFVNRRIGFHTIKGCEARTYQPIREYGGWGIRWGRSGRVYNVKGTRGVQLVLEGGARAKRTHGRRVHGRGAPRVDVKLMIGSQRADELAKVIREMTGG
jgi:hypothetical protein